MRKRKAGPWADDAQLDDVGGLGVSFVSPQATPPPSLPFSSTPQEKIVSFLKAKRHAVTTSSIQKELNFESKQSTNKLLYNLQKFGTIERANESPPKWKLKETLGAPSKTPFMDGANEENVVDFLRRAGAGAVIKALDIAKGIGYETVKPVNPALYALERSGRVKRVGTSPAMWTLTSHNASGKSSGSELRPRVFVPPSREPPSKKMRVSSNPIGILNEYKQKNRGVSLSYHEGSLGRGETGFCIIATLNGTPYEGKASTKKEAKALAAESACISIGLIAKEEDNVDEEENYEEEEEERKIEQDSHNPISLVYEYGAKNHLPVNVNDDFLQPGETGFRVVLTVGDFAFPGVASNKKAAKTKAAEKACDELNLWGKWLNPRSPPDGGVPGAINNMGRNPISLINEYAAKNGLVSESNANPSANGFVCVLSVGNDTFMGEGHTKKDARLIASEKACKEFGLFCPRIVPTPAGGGSTQADHIAELVHRKFDQLQRLAESTNVGRKVIAGFVVTSPMLPDGGIVVAVGSGTQCATGQNLSLRGETVNDCHAEIVARRSFKRFLYAEVNSIVDDGESILFKRNEDKLEIKRDVECHLYISTAPCGDSALFGAGSDDPAPLPASAHSLFLDTPKSQGLLRTKVEGGEGTIPIGNDEPPLTWDGIVTGQRLRTMSCSDKVARWNVLGLQGSLLAHFMPPIYLSSIVLGTLYHAGHLSRAVCCRLGGLGDSLPSPYRVSHPLLAAVSGANSRVRPPPLKATNASLNWCYFDGNDVEIVQATTGRLFDGRSSRASKSSLFELFADLYEKMTATRPDGSYGETKANAVAYQTAKQGLYLYLKSKGFGKWMQKPLEQESFSLA